MIHILRYLHILMVFVAVSGPANAQQQPITPVSKETTASEDVQKPAEAKSATWTGYLDSTAQALKREGLTEAELDEFFEEAGQIARDAAKAVSELQPRADQLAQQLEELGPKPEAGQPPEAEEIANRRTRLNAQFAEVDGKLKEAKLAFVRAGQIQKTATDIRRERFVTSITTRSPDAFEPGFWLRFSQGFSGFTKGLSLLFTDSSAVLVKVLGAEGWKQFALPFLLLLSALLFSYLRRFLLKFPERIGIGPDDKEAGNIVRSFFGFSANGLLGGLLPAALYLSFSILRLLTPRLDQFLSEIAISIGFFIVALWLSISLLRPSNPSARIVELSDGAAQRLFQIIVIGLVIAVAIRLLNGTAIILVSPFEVSFGLSFWFCFVVAAIYISGMISIGRDRRRIAQSHPGLVQTQNQTWRYVKMVIWVISVVIVISLLSGYVALAEFLSLQILFGSAVIGTLWLLLRVIEIVFAKMVSESKIENETGSVQITQWGVLGFGVLKLAAILAAAMLLLLPWGYRTRDFYEVINQAFFGFSIGGLNISVSTILTAIALFFVGYAITVAIRSWLNNRFLPTTKLDIGLSNSISTIFGYAGFILAAVLAITAAGFDLSNLAIVAGALSVGVGFGLQSIVNNFVSGLILLTERPIKSGDWVVTTGGEGTVKRISVRSTEIETFDRATIVVPNSTLITDPVTNWTHTNKLGRIIISVGVGYGSDPDEVRDILLMCASEHRSILRHPQPVAYFMDFGADALQFQLRAFLADINFCLEVQSALRFEIFRKFRAAGIEIPYPQRDLHIRSGLENFSGTALKSNGNDQDPQ